MAFPRKLVITRRTLFLTTLLLIGLELTMVVSGKPSAQPVELNGPISHQTDQRQYIDRTELFSYPMDMRDISDDDDDGDGEEMIATNPRTRKQPAVATDDDEQHDGDNMMKAEY